MAAGSMRLPVLCLQLRVHVSCGVLHREEAVRNVLRV